MLSIVISGEMYKIVTNPTQYVSIYLQSSSTHIKIFVICLPWPNYYDTYCHISLDCWLHNKDNNCTKTFYGCKYSYGHTILRLFWKSPWDHAKLIWFFCWSRICIYLYFCIMNYGEFFYCRSAAAVFTVAYSYMCDTIITKWLKKNLPPLCRRHFQINLHEWK